MHEDDGENYAVVRLNLKTKAKSVVMVVKGRSSGGTWAMRCERDMTEGERDAGWTFYSEKTTLPVNACVG